MVVRDGLAQKGFDINDLHRILTLGNSEAIAFAVQEGVGVGFVSMLVAQKIVKDQVAIVKIDGLELSQNIYIGQHRRLPSTSAQVAFWKMATEPQSEALLKIKSYLT
jgi:DNA-binding transcriptional LysR family regulator